MNNIKKLIIIILILIIVIIGIICILNISTKEKDDSIIGIDEFTVNNNLEKVIIKEDYYTVKKIVEKYYNSLCEINKTSEDILIFEYDEEVEKHLEEELEEGAKNNKQKTYNFFDENYIKETGISTENLQNKLGNYKDLYILIKDMYVRDITMNLKAYFVFGSITEKETLKTEDFQLMVAVDSLHTTFNIYTSDYIEKYNLYELSKEENFNEKVFNISQIENRKYNKYEYQIVNDETYMQELLKSFTQSIKYNNIEYSYNKLDEEYKTTKFKDFADYEKYIQENKNNITSATLKYYKSNIYEEYIQYVLMDQKGRYYIFNQNGIMDYNLILDTYTIDLPEFTEKYNTATTEEKVMLNIQKIVGALNEKDYKYIYNKLAGEFKENQFKTYEEFVKYAEDTFDIGIEATFNQYTESEDYCTYKVTLKGKNKTVIKTIVMKLEEGTNFVMSFNVK